jgi:hypothetical protein
MPTSMGCGGISTTTTVAEQPHRPALLASEQGDCIAIRDYLRHCAALSVLSLWNRVQLAQQKPRIGRFGCRAMFGR